MSRITKKFVNEQIDSLNQNFKITDSDYEFYLSNSADVYSLYKCNGPRGGASNVFGKGGSLREISDWISAFNAGYAMKSE